MNVKEDGVCLCGKCKQRFKYRDAIIKQRKLYNTEIEEKACPYCGFRGFSPVREIYWLGIMASQHTADGKRGKPT